MKKLFILVFLLIPSLSFAEVQKTPINFKDFSNEQMVYIVSAARSLVQEANNDKYIKVDLIDNQLEADMPNGLDLNKILAQDNLINEINKEITASDISAKQQKDELEIKKVNIQQKLNLTDDDLETLKRLLLN